MTDYTRLTLTVGNIAWLRTQVELIKHQCIIDRARYLRDRGSNDAMYVAVLAGIEQRLTYANATLDAINLGETL